MHKLSTLFFTLFALSTLTYAQHDFEFTIKGTAGQNVYLANYYGGQTYYNDTTVADENGVSRFKGNDTKPGGIYLVVLDDKQTYFEIVVNEPKIVLSTSADNAVGDMDIKVSDENKAFYSYLQFITGVQKNLKALNGELASAQTDEEKEKVKEKMDLQRTRAEEFKANYLKENGNLFAAKVLQTSDEVNVPEFKDENGEMDDEKRFVYYKKHYFDNVDMKDDRLLRTPVLHRKIDTYVQKMTPQIPDSVCAAVDYLTSLTNDTSLIFRYVVQYANQKYQNSEIMGMDAIFVCLAAKYYTQGKAFWLKDDQLKEITELYETRKNLIIGQTAENIILQDSAKQWRALYDVDAKYTVLIFWAPDCGHCKKEMPKLKTFYDEYKSKGVEVYAVSTEHENNEGQEFIRKNGFDWISVSDDPSMKDNAYQLIQEGKTTLNSLNFRTYWDIYSTPQLYVLDSNKVIIAKKIGAEQIGEFLTKYEKGLAAAKEAVKDAEDKASDKDQGDASNGNENKSNDANATPAQAEDAAPESAQEKDGKKDRKKKGKS